MEKVNMMIGIEQFKNAKNNSVLVKKNNNVAFVDKTEITKDLVEENTKLKSQIVSLNNKIKTLEDDLEIEKEKSKNNNEKLKNFIISLLIEVDIIQGEIDQPETKDEYDKLFNDYLRKVDE